MRTTNKVGATVWYDASGGVTYSMVIIYCYCAKHPNGAPMLRDETSKALTIDNYRRQGNDAMADYINLHGITSSAMRHEIAGVDDRLFLGCAKENNKRQQGDDIIPDGVSVFTIDDYRNDAVKMDRRIRDNDDEERDRRKG
jgi:hypothetical protein